MDQDKNKANDGSWGEDLDLEFADLDTSLAGNTGAGTGQGLPQAAAQADPRADALKNDSAKNENDEDKPLVIPRSKALILARILANIKESAEQSLSILSLLDEGGVKQAGIFTRSADMAPSKAGVAEDGGSGEKIVEGIFDGEKMIGPDGKQYTVPANYASKSKLVEGDMMKLTITRGGSFLYKQIGPVDRLRISGVLEKDANGNYAVVSDSGRWRVLSASITYFRGEPGDETVVLVPKEGDSRWAAVENIVRAV